MYEKYFEKTIINTLQDNECLLLKGSPCIEEFDGSGDEINLIKTTR